MSWVRQNGEAEARIRGYLSFFVPHYDELALFAMSFTCLLFLADILLGLNWHAFSFYQIGTEGLKFVIALFIFLYGMFLSLYHAFTDRGKSDTDKFVMLFFAVIINAISGAYGASYVIENTEGWKAVFPVINLINSAILIVLYRSRVIDQDSISNDNASLGRVFLTGIVVLTLYLICSRYLQLFWALTFSICVSYATNINKRLLTTFNINA